MIDCLLLDQADQNVGDEAKNRVEDGLDGGEETIDDDIQRADETTEGNDQRLEVDEETSCEFEVSNVFRDGPGRGRRS